MSWRGLDHRTVYEMVVNGGAGAGVSMDAEAAWASMQHAITRAEEGIAAAIQATRTQWEGAGADATRSAYSPLGSWAQDAALDAQLTASGVRGQAELAMNTRAHVAANAPPQNFLEYLHDQIGSWDGNTIYDEQAAAVDRLMTDYELASAENTRKLDYWIVPPTVVVTPATAAPGGAAGFGVVGTADTGGLGTTAVAPGAGVGVPPALGVRAAEAPLIGGGAIAGGAAPAVAAGAGGAGSGAAGSGGAGSGGGVGPGVAAGALPAAGAAGARGVGGAGQGGSAGAGGTAGAGPSPGAGRAAAGATGLGTGGVARPSDRVGPSAGGRGTGPGPWSRAAADAAAPRGAPAAFRPVVPGVAARSPVPDWRSVLLTPDGVPRDGGGRAAAVGEGPGRAGETASRPGAPGGAAGEQGRSTAGWRPAGPAAGPHGMYPPMAGAGVGGQPGERRRPGYLVDDSDVFVDRRWVSEAVIGPDDPL